MSPIPIDEAGIERIAVQEHDRDGGSRDCWERCKDAYVSGARETVSAYLEAVGAEVEAESVTPAGGGRMYWQSRLVTPWKPLTDTEEERPTTTLIEVCRDCRWNMATSNGYCPDCVAPDTEEETDGR